MARSNDTRFEPGDGPRDRSLRVGDRERDGVSEILKQHHLDGRLDDEEFQARLERCMAARTYADLDALTTDLPHERTAQRGSGPHWRAWPLAFPVLPLVLVVALIAGGHLGWLFVPLLVFVLLRVFVWNTWWWGGYGRGPWRCGPRRATRV